MSRVSPPEISFELISYHLALSGPKIKDGLSKPIVGPCKVYISIVSNGINEHRWVFIMMN